MGHQNLQYPFSVKTIFQQNFEGMRIVSVKFSDRQNLLLLRQDVVFALYQISDSHIRLHSEDVTMVPSPKHDVASLLKSFGYAIFQFCTAHFTTSELLSHVKANLYRFPQKKS